MCAKHQLCQSFEEILPNYYILGKMSLYRFDAQWEDGLENHGADLNGNYNDVLYQLTNAFPV